MRYLCLAFVLLYSFSFSSASQAQEICSNIDPACHEILNHQACYGGGSITTITRMGDVNFSMAGDTIDLSAIDNVNLMQASLVMQLNDTLKLTAYGNVEIVNQTDAPADVSLTLNANGRVRTVPEQTDNRALIINSINSGETVEALGRTEDGNWLLVRFPEQYMAQDRTIGWVSTQVLTIQGDRMALPVLNHDIILYQQASADRLQAGGALMPMSQLSFHVDDIENDCTTSGIVIESTKTNSITINNIEINLAGNAFVTTQANQLEIAVIEGYAIISNGEKTQLVPAGTQVNADLETVMPYQAERRQAITTLAPTITVAEPLAEDQIQAVINETIAPYGALSGRYRFGAAQVTQYAFETNAPHNITDCTTYHQYSTDVELTLTEDQITTTASYSQTDYSAEYRFPRVDATVFGNTNADHIAYQRVPSEISAFTTFPVVESFIILSPTEILWRYSTAYHHSTEWSGYTAGQWETDYYVKLACEYHFYGQWVGE